MMTRALSDTSYAFSGVLMRCLLTGRETAHAFCLFENQSPGASGTPVHLHEFEDETIYVLDGEIEVVIDGKSHVVPAGRAAFMPRGIPHQLKNSSGSPSRYSILCTPSGFEDFVATAGRVISDGEPATPPSPEEIGMMREAAPQFGIKLLPGFPDNKS